MRGDDLFSVRRREDDIVLIVMFGENERMQTIYKTWFTRQQKFYKSVTQHKIKSYTIRDTTKHNKASTRQVIHNATLVLARD